MPNKKNNGQPKDDNAPMKKKAMIVSKVEKAVIEDLFRSALSEYTAKMESKHIERADMIDRISGFVSEFLSAFIIIGYTMKGEPINIVHASNQMDMDALSSGLNKFLFNIHNNNE
jgi:hypothetical protein